MHEKKLRFVPFRGKLEGERDQKSTVNLHNAIYSDFRAILPFCDGETSKRVHALENGERTPFEHVYQTARTILLDSFLQVGIDCVLSSDVPQAKVKEGCSGSLAKTEEAKYVSAYIALNLYILNGSMQKMKPSRG